MLCGSRIALVPLDEKHLEDCVRWLNDEEIVAYVRHFAYASMAMEKHWFRNFIESKAGKTDYIWAIEVLDTGQHIGNSSLDQIDYVSQSCRAATIIGEKEFWGKRIAIEAAWLRAQFAFDVLGMNRIQAEILVENEQSMRCFAGTEYYPEGFYRKEGILRQAVKAWDRFFDSWVGSLLKEDFRKMKPPWEIAPEDFDPAALQNI